MSRRSVEARPADDVQGDNRWMDMVRCYLAGGPAASLAALIIAGSPFSHFAQHHQFVNEAHESEPEILWLGDSIVQHLVNSNIWERSFCQMHSLNFGISEDRTENLLWRLQNGELDGLAPKVIVLHIGSSNYGDSAEDIAEGIKAICSLIRDKQPQAYLVLLSLLPRGHKPNPLRERNQKVNSIVSEQLKGNSRAQLCYINPSPGFVQPDGTISHHDMLDFLHLTQRGYDRAFEPVNELLQQILSEFEGSSFVGTRTEAEGAAD